MKGYAMMEKIKPLGDRVLVKRVAQEETTTSGIIIPDSAKEKAQIGAVIAVGAGRRDKDGNLIPMAVKAGDKVYFGKYAGTEAGDEYLIVKEDEILGLIEQ
jgi:chaperonin GroES